MRLIVLGKKRINECCTEEGRKTWENQKNNKCDVMTCKYAIAYYTHQSASNFGRINLATPYPITIPLSRQRYFISIQVSTTSGHDLYNLDYRHLNDPKLVRTVYTCVTSLVSLSNIIYIIN